MTVATMCFNSICYHLWYCKAVWSFCNDSDFHLFV